MTREDLRAFVDDLVNCVMADTEQLEAANLRLTIERDQARSSLSELHERILSRMPVPQVLVQRFDVVGEPMTTVPCRKCGMPFERPIKRTRTYVCASCRSAVARVGSSNQRNPKVTV